MVDTIGLAGDMWFEAFAMPWLAQAAPVVIGVLASGSLLRTAGLVSVVLFSVGWILFGVASCGPGATASPLGGGSCRRSGRVPGRDAPWGVALGLAVAAVGIWLIRQDPTVQQTQTPLHRNPNPDPPAPLKPPQTPRAGDAPTDQPVAGRRRSSLVAPRPAKGQSVVTSGDHYGQLEKQV